MAMPNRVYEIQKYTSNPRQYKIARISREIGDEPYGGRTPRHDRYKSVRKGRCNGHTEPPVRDIAFPWPRSFRAGAPSPRYMKRVPEWWYNYM